MIGERSAPLGAPKNSPRVTYPSICQFIESRLGLSLERGVLPGSLDQFVERKKVTFGVNDEAALASVLSCAAEPLLSELIDAVTVPYSWLFRDYEQLCDAVDALVASPPSGRPSQIWVPACAGGEDAHSISAIAQLTGKHVDVLATDINGRVLDQARTGTYGPFSARNIPGNHQHQLALQSQGLWSFHADVRDRVSVLRHNLLDAPPRSAHGHGGWDLIVCRNVFIYFARAQAMRVLNSLRGALAPQGLLVLGASDIVLELPVGLNAVDLNGRLAFQLGVRTAGKGSWPLEIDINRFGGAEQQIAASDRNLALPNAVPKSLLDVAATTSPFHARQTTLKNAPIDDDREDRASAVDDMLDGILFYLAGDLSQAAQRLRAALFHCADLWPAAYYLALSYDDLGRRSEAQREYQRTVELIGRRIQLPSTLHRDFSFLERDILGLATRRALGNAR